MVISAIIIATEIIFCVMIFLLELQIQLVINIDSNKNLDYCNFWFLRPKALTKKEFQVFIGKRIKQLRENKNLSQVELANLCDFERSNMSRIEMGNTCPSSYTLYKIAVNLKVDVFELLKFEDTSE